MPAPIPLDYRRENVARPGALLWIVAALVWLGCLVIASAIVSLMIEGGWSIAFAILGLPPVLTVGFIEFAAVVWRNKPCLAILVVLFGVPVLGVIRLIFGIAGLLGMKSIDREFNSWDEVLSFAALLTISGLIAYAHFRWMRRIQRFSST